MTWRPAGRRTPVLAGLDLRVGPGERVLLAGPSGAGKSTLLRALAGLLLAADVGDLSGSVTVDGEPPQSRPGTVGLLLQDPAAAVVADRVGRDVAFGLENLAVPQPDMAVRVQAALDAAAFPYPVGRATRTLSGGELQRLALAGALVLEPRVLLLDEPTAMLDDENAASVRDAVVRLCAERGTTLVVVEHRMEPWLPYVDRCVVLSADGSIIADGPADSVFAAGSARLAESGVWVPGVPAPCPVPVPAGLVAPVDPPSVGTVVVRAVGATVRYRALASRLPGRARPGPAISSVDASLVAGRALAVTGGSGAGKSTLLLALGGLLRAESGSVELADGRPVSQLGSAELARLVAWLPQLPEHGFVSSTVLGEVLATSRALGLDLDAAARRGRSVLEVLGLAGLERRNPYTLSGGEQRRLLLGASLVHGPHALLLDEPTLAQDRNTWAAVTGLLQAALGGGAAAGVATHDPALLAMLAGPEPGVGSGAGSGAGTCVGSGAGPGAASGDGLDLGSSVGPGAASGDGLDLGSSVGHVSGSGRLVLHRAGAPRNPRNGSDPGQQRAADPIRSWGLRGLLRAAGPLSLLAATLLAVVGALAITSARHGLLTVAVLVFVLLTCVDGWAATAARAAIGVFAAFSLALTTWLYAGHSIDSALGAASRVLYLVLPGMVLASYLDPVRLGDHLAQRLGMPHRPVVASCVALQRLDAIGDDFDQIRRARRSRGLAADHGFVRRLRAMAGMTFSLLVSTLRSAGPTSLAMDARGFATATRRTWAEPAPWVAADWVVLALGLALATVPWLTR